eukprot:jgi/Mesvir1/28140/Mv26567-RA.1
MIDNYKHWPRLLTCAITTLLRFPVATVFEIAAFHASKVNMAQQICLMSSSLRQDTSVSNFWLSRGYKVKDSNIVPDVIFPSKGGSLPFIMVGSNYDSQAEWTRIEKMADGFKYSYVVVIAPPGSAAHEEFFRRYVERPFLLGKPCILDADSMDGALLLMLDIVRGFAGAWQAQAQAHESEQEQAATSQGALASVLQAIPGLTEHEADMLLHAFGSISDIFNLKSVDAILDKTALSSQQAHIVLQFVHELNMLHVH